MSFILEIACFDPASCLIAEAAGADRIEFCADYNSGGITPLYSDIVAVKKQLKIPLHIIIRPREGNFIYSLQEIDQIKKDILFCVETKIDGVVFGLLTKDNIIDTDNCKELKSLAGNMKTVFHRAIDKTTDIENSVETIIDIGFDKVLTSGGKGNAIDGINTLKTLNQKFGKKISIMPGGGIRSVNINQLREITGCSEFHSAALKPGEFLANSDEVKLMKGYLKE